MAGKTESPITALLYVTFFFTGIGVVLPGTLLSELFARWHMDDSRAGLLFLFFSIGSSVGAVLARGKLSRTLPGSCLVVCVGSIGISMDWRQAPLTLIAIYGCGLGTAMTSISLLQSRRRSKQRASEMSRLNLVWALGACSGPFLLLEGAAKWSVTSVVHAAALVFLLLAALLATVVTDVRPEANTLSARASDARLIPIPLLLLIPLATGIESAVGGWLSTYAARAGDALGLVISATTAFWAGLVLSRLFHSTRRETKSSARSILRVHPWLVVVGMIGLIGSRGGSMSVWAALVIGSGVGPLYPLALALLLDLGEVGNAGFLLAGTGASLLPMLTGLAAARAHSLRAGLGVLLVCGGVSAVLGTVLLRNLHKTAIDR